MQNSLIACYGKDNKIHACRPSDNESCCGMPVRQKNGISYGNGRFWCYECSDALERQENDEEST